MSMSHIEYHKVSCTTICARRINCRERIRGRSRRHVKRRPKSLCLDTFRCRSFPGDVPSAWKATRNGNRKILRIRKQEKDMKKTSKTILITGASSGFCRDMAETLAAGAHKVFGGVRDLAGRNSAAAEALRGKGVEGLALDVTSDAGVEDGFKSLPARSGCKLVVVIINPVA